MAVPGIALAIAAVALGGPLFAFAAALVAVLGLYELYSLTAAARPLRWAGYLGTVLIVALAYGSDDAERGILAGLGLALALVAVAALILSRRDDITTRMATTLMGVVYLGLPMGSWWPCGSFPDGAGAVANVLVGVWVFDTASYLGGRMWGTHPDRAAHLAEEDRRGGAIVGRGGDPGGLDRRALHGLDQGLGVAAARPRHLPGGLPGRPLRVDAQAGRRREGLGAPPAGPRRGARPLRRPAVRPRLAGLLRDGLGWCTDARRRA